MNKFGFVRVSICIPFSSPGDINKNKNIIISNIEKAYENQSEFILFPELSLTGYTCHEMFNNSQLINQTEKALEEIIEKTKFIPIISIIGLPIIFNNSLYNCAMVIYQSEILGIIPKSYIPNYREFYEGRYFQSGINIENQYITLFNQKIPFGRDLIFSNNENKYLKFGIEICEDMWVFSSPSIELAKNGAILIFNLSSSPIIVGKEDYRNLLLKTTSSKLICGYIYASSGTGESTTDLVFDGDGKILEYGNIINQTERFSRKDQIIYGDIDIEKLYLERVKIGNLTNKNINYRTISYSYHSKNFIPEIKLSKTPFVPQDKETLSNRCNEILNIQIAGLSKRLESINIPKSVIGLSGGLDSTLALIVTMLTYQKLGKDFKEYIKAITMPGYGTTDKTLNNVKNIANTLKLDLEIVPINQICESMFDSTKIDKDNHNVTFENIQARARTYILMTIANKINGIVIGTGDLSELALGWCTYNGDHISMYNVNGGIPKTLVKFVIKEVVNQNLFLEINDFLEDILNLPISPELIPSDGKNISQYTEEKIGPYILHDFFLYYFVRWNFSKEKIFYLAKLCFEKDFSEEEIEKHLNTFFKRFFTNQWKRDCVPASPKVGSVDLSPRGSFRLASDFNFDMFL